MDIEEFYDGDPRRRASDESEFGREWHGADGVRYELSWVHDTGELYLMTEPVGTIISDGLGDENLAKMATESVVVEVLTTVASPDDVQRLLAGWSDAMTQPDSLQWLRDRVAAGVDGSTGAVSPDDRPDELPGASS